MTVPEIDADFEDLLEHLRTERAVDFTGYKRASLMRLVNRRMQAVGIAGYRDYQDHLEVDPAEFARLFDGLLINVTSFFRDPTAWAAVRTRRCPSCSPARRTTRRSGVWSAACASGEEAYTWMVVLAEALGRERSCPGQDLRDRHRRGCARGGPQRPLPAQRARGPRPGAVERYFEPDGASVVVRPEYRSCVIFGRHDLIQDAPISRISLLSCRNVLMYFNHETQSRVLERLAFALADQGLLLLGRAEMLLTQGDIFTPGRPAEPAVRQEPARARGLRGATARAGGTARWALLRVAQTAFDRAPEPQLVLGPDGELNLVNDSALRRLGLARDRRRPALPGPRRVRRPVELRRRGRRGPDDAARRSSVQGVGVRAATRARWSTTSTSSRSSRTTGVARGPDHLRRRHPQQPAHRRAVGGAARARDGLRGAAERQRGARDHERGAPVGGRGARDDQRGAPEHQRGARDDERGAAEHQRGAADPQRRAARPHGRGQPGQRLPREHPVEPARRGRRRRPRPRREGLERAGGAAVGAARVRGAGPRVMDLDLGLPVGRLRRCSATCCQVRRAPGGGLPAATGSAATSHCPSAAPRCATPSAASPARSCSWRSAARPDRRGAATGVTASSHQTAFPGSSGGDVGSTPQRVESTSSSRRPRPVDSSSLTARRGTGGRVSPSATRSRSTRPAGSPRCRPRCRHGRRRS